MPKSNIPRRLYPKIKPQEHAFMAIEDIPDFLEFLRMHVERGSAVVMHPEFWSDLVQPGSFYRPTIDLYFAPADFFSLRYRTGWIGDYNGKVRLFTEQWIPEKERVLQEKNWVVVVSQDELEEPPPPQNPQ